MDILMLLFAIIIIAIFLFGKYSERETGAIILYNFLEDIGKWLDTSLIPSKNIFYILTLIILLVFLILI